MGLRALGTAFEDLEGLGAYGQRYPKVRLGLTLGVTGVKGLQLAPCFGRLNTPTHLFPWDVELLFQPVIGRCARWLVHDLDL